ncbi:MAG: 30S ribosomal protein S6 [Planctomycetes bacterium]|jgi:small subunit ribosomal protein S6|nr:30S ribosomal protein S6 [Planctomycetota bacterium]
MARVKTDKIPHYELLYIVSNKFTEDEVKPVIAKVNKLIEKNGGLITYQEEWGKKKLAYPIKLLNYGYYNLVEFNLTDGEISKLNQALTMESDVVRHQITTKRVKTEAEIKKEREISEKIATQAIVKEKIAEEKKKGKVDLKELDERLDRILETDDLL